MSDELYTKTRDRYASKLEKLFLPPEQPPDDIIKYFSSLLRVNGIEDIGWDPYAESRSLLFDVNSFFKIKLPKKRFPNPGLTTWRLGLLMYSHILEMDAPYEVITNLMRYQLGHGYSPNPYYKFLNAEGRKKFKSRGLYPLDKIAIIKKLDKELSLGIGDIFDEFYNADLRNAISHSDFVLTEKQFRVRNKKSFSIELDELDKTLTNAKAFIGSVFELDYAVRKMWGKEANKALAYDPIYKGLIQILVDEDKLMCGFKVHWPNNSESFYRRSDKGVDMVNCYISPDKGAIEMMVGLYPQRSGRFSPLVEDGDLPKYRKLENGTVPRWPNERVK